MPSQTSMNSEILWASSLFSKTDDNKYLLSLSILLVQFQIHMIHRATDPHDQIHMTFLAVLKDQFLFFQLTLVEARSTSRGYHAVPSTYSLPPEQILSCL